MSETDSNPAQNSAAHGGCPAAPCSESSFLWAVEREEKSDNIILTIFEDGDSASINLLPEMRKLLIATLNDQNQ